MATPTRLLVSSRFHTDMTRWGTMIKFCILDFDTFLTVRHYKILEFGFGEQKPLLSTGLFGGLYFTV